MSGHSGKAAQACRSSECVNETPTSAIMSSPRSVWAPAVVDCCGTDTAESTYARFDPALNPESPIPL